MLQRVLSPIVDLRREESLTAVLMFAYSFLAMAGYNVIKPATRSQFINSLGADNIPYVQLVAGLIMGFVIQGYTSAMRLLPRRWVVERTFAWLVQCRRLSKDYEGLPSSSEAMASPEIISFAVRAVNARVKPKLPAGSSGR